ncbi:MAG: site-specific integrase [Clostridiaceae bacterium]|nr:site-specific integrase [Clostridiaceae bacterium]
MPKNRIHKMKDGRYSYSVTDQIGNRHSIKSRQNETYGEFRDRCDILDEVAEGQVIQDNFNLLFYQWLEDYVKLNNSQNDYDVSKQLYESHVKPYLGHRKPHEISRADAYSVLARAKKNKLSSSTIKKIRSTISRPFNWAINSLGYKLTAPTQGLRFKYPETNNKIRFLSDSDQERFFKAAENSEYYNYFKILFLTGLRPSECLGLKNINIKKDHLEIRQAWTRNGLGELKTVKSQRDFPIFNELRKYLHQQRTEAMQNGSEWLFPGTHGLPSMNAVQQALKRILRQTAVHERGGRNGLKKLKLIRKPVKCTLYDFRHTFATRQAENGMPIHILAELMGHEDTSTTMKYYVGLTEEMIDQAKNILNCGQNWGQNQENEKSV